jgi:hypothetical protein
MPDTRTFAASETALAALQTKLASHNLTADLSKPGEAKESGWDVEWVPSPTRIAITVVKHPFLEESAFWTQIANILGPPVA